MLEARLKGTIKRFTLTKTFKLIIDINMYLLGFAYHYREKDF